MSQAGSACPCCGGAFTGLYEAWRAAAGTGISAPAPINRRSFIAGTTLLAGVVAGLPKLALAGNAPVTLFHGGTILTVDAAFSEAEALLVEGRRILATGPLAELRARAGSGAQEVDLAGRVLLPGFVDAHTHVVAGALADAIMENVGMTRFNSVQAVLTRLTEMATSTLPGDWIMARNYDPGLQPGLEALTFVELDAVSDTIPVFVMNASGHLAYANRAAFAAAGIPEDVANPPGAEFVRDAEGQLTGVMKNNVAFLQVASAAPAMARAEPVSAIVRLLKGWSSKGLTTVSELSLGALTSSPHDTEILFAAAATGQLTARIRAYPFYTIGALAWDAAGVVPGQGDALARVAGYKLVADGSNQGFTGFQRENYLNSDSRGLAYMTPEELTAVAVDRGRKGWPLAIHANGDAAIDMALDACAAVQAEGIDLAALRPRIEHCSMLHDDQIRRMKELGVSASFLIGHVHFWGVWMRDRVFGPDRVQNLVRANSTGAAGVGFSLHSDFMVTDPDPLHMIQMAVTRNTWAEPGFVLNPAERITVEAAIRAMTAEAAWQLGSEHEVGSLEAGKLADLVILSADPRKVASDQIKYISVSETWMDGARVYAA